MCGYNIAPTGVPACPRYFKRTTTAVLLSTEENSRKAVFDEGGKQHNFTQAAPNELKLSHGGEYDD